MKLLKFRKTTFREKVGILVHGADPVEVEFVFRHRTRREFAALCAELRQRTLAARTDDALDDVHVWYVMRSVASWGLEEPFTAENVRTLLQSYQGALRAIATTYTLALVRAHAAEDVDALRRELDALMSPVVSH